MTASSRLISGVLDLPSPIHQIVPMSIQRVRAEIDRFLHSTEPEVLCVRGEWGVGKTYSWKTFLKEAARKRLISLPKYSYVSTYGLKDLPDLRSALFRNRVSTADLAKGSNEITLAESVGSLYKSAKKYIPQAGEFFGSRGKAISSVIDELAFQSIRSQIVCLDDLERASAGLSLRDIMGMASFLKEERACKVVLLLNEYRLEGENRADFDLHFEKVVDASLVFQPSAKEASDIGLNHHLACFDHLSRSIEQVGLVNIRLIKSIERLVKQVSDNIRLTDSFLQQVSHTITIASVIKFGAIEGGHLDALRGFNSIATTLAGNAPKDPLDALLEKAGYTSTDAVDQVLIDAVENGYVNYDTLGEAISKASAEQIRFGRETRFSKAWDLYHQTLFPDADEVIESLYSAVVEEPETVSMINLNGTAKLFRDLGRGDMADEMVRRYFEVRMFPRDALESEVLVWHEGPVDPAIHRHFERLNEEFVDTRDPAEVLQKMATDQEWSHGDIELLQSLSPDQLVKMFQRMQGPDLNRSLKMALRFVDSLHPPESKFGANLRAAFDAIAKDSTIVARRLEGLGYRPRPKPLSEG